MRDNERPCSRTRLALSQKRLSRKGHVRMVFWLAGFGFTDMDH